MSGIGWFATLGESVMMIMGIVFVICVLAFRRGIMGELDALRRRVRTPTPAPEPQS